MEININELTLAQIKELKMVLFPEYSSGEELIWKIGEKYIVRTVTMITTGELMVVTDKELLFKDAAWIADTGRYADALKDINVFKEVEPYVNDAIVGRGAIVDGTIIPELPLLQK